MARCTNCNVNWKTRDVWSLFFAKEGKECPNCKTKQYPSFKNKEAFVTLGYFSGVVAAILIFCFPFYIRLSEKEENWS